MIHGTMDLPVLDHERLDLSRSAKCSIKQSIKNSSASGASIGIDTLLRARWKVRLRFREPAAPRQLSSGLFFDGSSERGSNRAFAGSKIRVPFFRATKAAMSVALATAIQFDSGKLFPPGCAARRLKGTFRHENNISRVHIDRLRRLPLKNGTQIKNLRGIGDH